MGQVCRPCKRHGELEKADRHYGAAESEHAMIRHTVLVKFRSDTSDDDRAIIFEDLERLGTVIPGMSGFAASENVSPENLGRGFTHGFTIDFEDVSARDAYLVHPQHQAAGARLVSAAAGGIDGVLVFDIEC